MAEYNPTNWVENVTKATADRMNNIETGITNMTAAISDANYGYAEKCLNMLDGTAETYKSTMRKYFRYFLTDSNDPDAEELTALCDDWYALTRPDWCGYAEFYQPDVSAVSYDTAGGDNADMECTPSTDTTANTDDYAGHPLFACVDVNFVVDPGTLMLQITAIDGITDNFKRSDPEAYVGVMQMSGYIFRKENASTYIWGYSANRNINYSDVEPLGSAVDTNGDFREWVCHAKYPNSTVNGLMTSCSGRIPTAFLSHNSVHTLAKKNGEQYSGTCTVDDEFLKIMMVIKYKSLTLDGILQGCVNNSYQYIAQVSESGVKRVLISTSHNLEAGMGVLIGNYTSSGTDRAYLYSITGQAGAIITKIETVTVSGTEYSAIYVDTDDTFDTTANGSATVGTTYISTFHWPTGTTDGVLGNDGSPVSNTSGKYPAKLQGIEIMPGGYELIVDAILSLYADDDGTYWYEPYICKTASLQSTAITANYEASGLTCEQAESTTAWSYIKKLGWANGCMFPIETGGSSSTYTRDGFYKNAEATGTRAWLARGGLGNGVASGGLSCLNGNAALPNSHWGYASRLSCNGNRGEWTA